MSGQAAVEFFLEHWADGKVEVRVPPKSKKSSAGNKPQSSPSEQLKAKPQSSLSHASQSAGAKSEFSSSGSSGFSWMVQSPPEPMKKYVEDADKEWAEEMNRIAVSEEDEK